jgi:hypothetical protein
MSWTNIVAERPLVNGRDSSKISTFSKPQYNTSGYMSARRPTIRPPNAGDAAFGNPVALCNLSTVSIASDVHLDNVIDTNPQKTPSKRYKGSSDIYEVM